MPSGLPVTYTNAYVGGLNPLTASALPSQPDTTPRNLTWNVRSGARVAEKCVLARRLHRQPHDISFCRESVHGCRPGEQSFLALTNTGSSHYRELESTVHFTFRQKR